MKWFSWHGVRAWLAAVMMLAPVGVPLAEADYGQGLAFYNSGNYAEAFKESLSLAPEGNVDAEQAVADRQDWVSWEDGGFSLRHPEGWRAAADDRGAVSVSGPEGESILVWPVFSPDRIDGNRALQLVASLTAKLDRGAGLRPRGKPCPAYSRPKEIHGATVAPRY